MEKDYVARVKEALLKVYEEIVNIKDCGLVTSAYILASCLIDYLAGYRYCTERESTRNDYIMFVNKYLNRYNGKNLYELLRCRLIHNYSEGGNYLLVHNQSQLHLDKCNDKSKPYYNKKTYINLENFILEIKESMDKFFCEIDNNEQLQEEVKRRVIKFSILEPYNIEESYSTITFGSTSI